MASSDDDAAAAATATAAANAAFVDEDYAAAEAHYTRALTKKPGNADLLCGRAAARLKLGSWIGAADDARRASAASPGLAKAHMRRGIALFHLDEFEASRDSLARAVELFEEQKTGGGSSSSSDATARRWLRKALAELGEGEGGGEGKALSSRCGCGLAHPHSHSRDASPLPEKEKKKEAAASAASGAVSAVEEKKEEEASAKAATAAEGAEASPPPSPPPAPPPPAPPQQQQQQQQQPFRHQWFQTHDAVEVGVLAKGLSEEDVAVDIEPRRLVVVIKKSPSSSSSASSSSPMSASAASAASASEKSKQQPPFTLDLPLAGRVVPSESKHVVLSSKVEIRLRKAVPGIAWPSLEVMEKEEKEGEVANESAPAPPLVPPPPAPETTATTTTTTAAAAVGQKPSYPSSNPKRIDWDQLDRELGEDEDKELEEAEDGEEKLQRLFETIFSGGDDDVRRAMNKSFVESGGTCLSTSWSDVSKGKVGEDYCGGGEDDDDDDEGGLAKRDDEEEDD